MRQREALEGDSSGAARLRVLPDDGRPESGQASYGDVLDRTAGRRPSLRVPREEAAVALLDVRIPVTTGCDRESHVSIEVVGGAAGSSVEQGRDELTRELQVQRVLASSQVLVIVHAAPDRAGSRGADSALRSATARGCCRGKGSAASDSP